MTARYLRAKTRSLDLAMIHRLLRRALAVSLARTDFRIVHIAIVRSRLELVVEADDKVALARGLQGFQVSAAKALNRAVRRRGAVFPDRYRMRVLTTRAEVRGALGRLPLARTTPATSARTAAGIASRTGAWPQTWLLTLELSAERNDRVTPSGRAPPRSS